MIQSIGTVFFFLVFICVWWAVVNPTEDQRKGGLEAANPWTAPIGVLAITAVFIMAMFFHYAASR